MPTTQTEIQLDDEVLAAVTSTLKTYAEQLDAAAQQAVHELEEMMLEPLKQQTGAIPPVYQDLADALKATIRRMERINTKITTMIRNDAATIANQVEQQGDLQHRSASQVNALDVDMPS